MTGPTNGEGTRDDGGRRGPGQPVSAFYRISDHVVGGWIFDPQRPGHRHVVELRIEGEHAGLALAESFVAEVRSRFGNDGCYGFTAPLNFARCKPGDVVEAVVANTGQVIGRLAAGARQEPAPRSRGIRGAVAWHGGLVLEGWACDVSEPGRRLDIAIAVDRRPAATAVPNRWKAADDVVPGLGGLLAFTVVLPADLADGEVHLVQAFCEGAEIDGSPLRIVVHEAGYAGLARHLDPADRSGLLGRAELLDRLLPAFMPADAFEAWRRRFPVEPPPAARGGALVLVLDEGSGGTERTLRSLEGQSHAAWTAMVMDCAAGTGFSGPAFGGIVDEILAADADAVVMVLTGSVLQPHALAHLCAALEHPDAPGLVTADVVRAGPGGRLAPSFRPVPDPIRMRSQGYCADLFAVPVDIFEHAARDGAGSVFDILLACLRACEERGEAMGHVPQLLATVPALAGDACSAQLAQALARDRRARGLDGRVEAAPGDAYPLARAQAASGPGVSARDVALLVIEDRTGPPPDARKDLENLLACLEAAAGVAIPLFLAGHGAPPPSPSVAGGAQAVSLGAVAPAQAVRSAARSCGRAVLLVVDGECRVDAGAVDVLVDRVLDGEAGVAGPVVVDATGRVVDAGWVLGPLPPFAPAMAGEPGTSPGAQDLLLGPRRVSALSPACLAVDTRALGEAEDLDAAAAAALGPFWTVDLCLRLARAGHAAVVDPQARVVVPGTTAPAWSAGPALRAGQALLARWGDILADDPCHNPNLPVGFGAPVDGGLAAPPRHRRLRLNLLARNRGAIARIFR